MPSNPLLKTLASVLVVGSVTIDRNVFADRIFLKVGGVATYAGLTYRRHALTTWVVCNVAPADAEILAPLRREGIQVQNGRTPRTTRFVNCVRANQRTQEAPSLAEPIRYRQITTVLKNVDCVHLGPLHPDDIDPEVFGRIAHSDARVALDIQGLVRRNDHGRMVPAVSDRLAAALRAADIVKADAEELDRVLETCGARIETLMDRFDIAEWAVTSGSSGGCIHVRGGCRYPYASAPVATPIDSTGAGDVFLAAYTAARFHLRQTVVEACRHAARLSSEHVAGRYIAAERLDLSHRSAVFKQPRSAVDKKAKEG
jgi:sugar/nucleoside kinase (ribokinase family)